jgi:hypothetical protein
MKDLSSARFVYLDTNVLSELAKKREWWPAVREYLLREDLTIAVSSQAAELASANRLHEALADIFTALPTAVIKPSQVVLAEEIRAHPRERGGSFFAEPSGRLLGANHGDRLRDFLGSEQLRAARELQRRDATQMATRIAHLRSNFPPEANGRYTKEQASGFAYDLTVQWLAGTDIRFLQQFADRLAELRVEVFKSVRLFAMVLYYKYYLAGRVPKSGSDFGDLFHLYALPYCAVAVLEKDLANVLGQIKRNDAVLESTEIHNLGFLRALVALPRAS